MKHIHNQAEKVSAKLKDAAKLFAARLRLSFVNSIDCTEASYFVFLSPFWFYLFI